jgi:excisionase family DNA binding protein
MMKEQRTMPEPITVSVSQAVAMTGLSQATLYRMMDRDEIASVKLGGRRLLNVQSLKKLVGAA